MFEIHGVLNTSKSTVLGKFISSIRLSRKKMIPPPWYRLLCRIYLSTRHNSRPFNPLTFLSFSTEAKPQKKLKIPSCYNPYGPRPPPSDKILKLADEIASLPPEERRLIGPCLRDKLRAPRLQMLSAAAAMSMPVSAGAPKVEEKKAEKTAFNVKLEKFDTAAKIKVIKEVRAFTDLGLKEAKELVEKAPVILKQGLTKEMANDIIEKIKAAGGVAVME